MRPTKMCPAYQYQAASPNDIDMRDTFLSVNLLYRRTILLVGCREIDMLLKWFKIMYRVF